MLCLEGELHTELRDRKAFILTPCTSYQVGDEAEPHRSFMATGANVFIVD